jgi:cytochrome c peroxidase
MAVFNLAWHHGTSFFWDGRTPDLHDQVLIPIQDSLEMNETLDNVIAKLSNSNKYRNQFIRAFESGEISADNIASALEQFLLTIISARSKYDKYLDGLVELSDSERRGLEIFERSFNASTPENPGANCDQCHGGINFENGAFMNNGLDTDENMLDLGRQNTTGSPTERGDFKVPSLRNIAITPPYMHDGRFNTLEEVIDHYNEGLQPSSTLDPSLAARVESGMQLNDQAKTDLINFLKTLTDEEFIVDSEFASPF